MAAKSSHRVLKAALALALLVVVTVGGWLWQGYRSFADTPVALAGSERVLSVEPGDPHVRRFVAPEPVRQVSLVVRRPFVRRKLLEELSRCIRKALPMNGTAKRRVVPLS